MLCQDRITDFERFWSLIIGRTSQITRSDIEIPKPLIINEIENEEWIPYTDKGLSKLPNARQPSNIRSVYRSFSELSEVVHECQITLYSRGNFPKSDKILAIYKKCLEWYDGLPDQLRLGLNSTPTVLFTQWVHPFMMSNMSIANSLEHILPYGTSTSLPTLLESSSPRFDHLPASCLQRSVAKPVCAHQLVQRPLHTSAYAIFRAIIYTDWKPHLSWGLKAKRGNDGHNQY